MAYLEECLMEDKSDHSSNKKLLNWWGKLYKIADIRTHIQTATKIHHPVPPLFGLCKPFNKNNNNSYSFKSQY